MKSFYGLIDKPKLIRLEIFENRNKREKKKCKDKENQTAQVRSICLIGI